MADITLVNLNMLFMRYGEEVERELHVPLGPLYLARPWRTPASRSISATTSASIPTSRSTWRSFWTSSATRPRSSACPAWRTCCPSRSWPCGRSAQRYPDRELVLGGVGTKAVEEKLLARFPWINIICRGEAERTAPELLAHDPARRRPGRRRRAFLPQQRPRVAHARPPADHRPRLDPLPRLREGGPGALRGLRDDDQPRLPVPLHVLLRGPGLEPGELHPQPAEHRCRDGVPPPRGGRGPVPLPGRVLRLRQAAGDGVLRRAAAAAA